MKKIEPSKRLLSLDVLRGITIVGMIFANQAGACGYAYAPFKHVRWDGFTPADLVFPMFMFLMGISTYISLRKYNFKWRSSIFKILKRSLLLVLIGIGMAWIVDAVVTGNWLDVSNLRIMGVMQRLGICYGITALMALFIPHKRFFLVASLMLVGYFLLQLFGNGFEKCPENIVAIIDSAILGNNHLYQQGEQFLDPEGILSTIPAVAQVMIGFACGRMIITNTDNRERMLKLFTYGTVMLFTGYLFSYASPINKHLWSPSFVLVTCGIAALLLALLIYIIDVKQYKKWSSPFEVFGANPLILYVTSYLVGSALGILNVPSYIFRFVLYPLFGNYFGSFMYAVLFLVFLWAIGYFLLKKKIYIKL